MLRRRSQLKERTKETPRREFPSHRAWVRGFICAAHESGECEGKIEAAHLRLGLPPGEHGGTGIKPRDIWCFPLCQKHHAESHRIGEATFQAQYKLNLLALCEKLAATSPHRKHWQNA